MKYLIATLSLLLLLMTNSCKKVDEWTQFTMDFDEEVEAPFIPEPLLNIPIPIPTPDIPTNSDEAFAINNTARHLVEHAYLKVATLNIPAENKNFNFLNSIKIFIVAENLPEVLVASKTNIPNPIGYTLELDTEPADLEKYIKKDFFRFNIKVVADEEVNEEVIVKVHAEFFIDAKILGV